MKIVNNMQQGSVDWLHFRATRFGSSEAAAMLGLSSYTTRSELLRIKHTGLDREFGDWFKRNVLDKGHAVEAATRPMIEDQIGDALYPVVCQDDGRLVASCDGMDLDGHLLWECKQWNEKLATEVAAGRVPETHMPQCQHQLLVTGAARLLFTVSDGTGERLVSTEVLPSPEWFQRLRDGWEQFGKDLTAYTPPAAAPPAPVGKAPDTLPALMIQVTGTVTASNLVEFKATALGAIRAVNRDLKTDADFADADKAVKWCADVESRIKAAKEHAQGQAADIDALFKTLDDITAEARTVRLDLGKLVDRRKLEMKEQAVVAARKALDEHIADLNGELAPMRLQPVAADFPGAIKGLRSISSMQDALDSMLANGKIAADGQARLIRANVAHFKKTAGGMEFLFSDLGALVNKSPDDFEAVLAGRIRKHMDAVAEQERKRQADEASRIAAAEDRARQQEAARISAATELAYHQEQARLVEEQRLRDAAAQAMAAAVVVAAPAQQQPEQSPPLAQDLCSPLSAVLASKPDAPMHAREAAAEIHGSRMHDPATCHACLVAAAPQMTLGMLNEWLAPLQISGAGLELLEFSPAGRYKDTMLYFDEDKIRIADKMIEHLKILRRIP